MRPRSQSEYRFSGPPTWDPAALGATLADAQAVRLWRGGFLVFADSPEDDVLAPETLKHVSLVAEEEGPSIDDPHAIAELLEALAVSEVTDFMCMCTGDAAAEFFDSGHQLIATVRFDFPSRIAWPHWPGDANLAEPARLAQWFATHYDIVGKQ